MPESLPGFEWDDDKNRQNIQKHGIDFEDACDVFAGLYLSFYDSRREYGEDRWLAIGLMKDLTVVVVFVEESERVRRIISARKAQSSEKKRYEDFVKEISTHWD
ncbi:MAG: BrnT family toxin [Planctomycetaceae bacterium]|nr:BrnT family toxin [Planctomycetaceae bacterium]